MNTRTILLLAAIAFGATNVWAFDEEDSFSNYESIVNELKSSAEDVPQPREHALEAPDWDAVALHGGLGFTASYVNLEVPEFGVTSSGLLKGFEAHFGFNLFSRDARAEATFRNFAHDAISNSFQADMREAELAIVFLPMLRDKTHLRMGAALSERFMDIQFRAPEGNIHRSWDTPYYALMLGFEHKIAKTVAIGPDFAHHAPLDASSYSKSAWDASFRLNATF